MFVDFNILNQLGSPSINSNTFANRPSAGQVGRLFVSTDTFEIYRDNGTGWDLIGGPGSSTVTGSGAAGQVTYWTGTNSVGGENNLWWDAANNRFGVNTNTPTAAAEVVQTDGVALYSNFTTNAGSGPGTTAILAKNTTNSSGYAAVIEERTPNVSAGQYPVLIRHTLSSGTAAANMATGIHFGLPDDAGTERINQFSMDTVDAAAATYSSRYRFLLRNNGSAVTPFYITGTGLGVFTATPGAALDIHSTGIIAQLNSTGATNNGYLAFQRSGTGVWRIGDTYNGGNNYFELHNTVLSNNALQVSAATNKTTWQATETYSTGLARGNYFDYNLSVAAGGSFSSPNAITSLGASLDLSLAGNATIPSGARSGLDAYNSIAFTGTGTLTQNQGSQLRTYANLTTGWAFNGSATGTITHLSGIHVRFPDNSGSAIAITNNYGLLINDQTANTGTVTYTNRWGVYQEGTSDLNYFAANTLIGTTVNNGFKLQVAGDIYTSQDIYINNGRYLKLQRNSGSLYIDTIGIPAGTDDVRILTTGQLNVVNGSLTSLFSILNNGNSICYGQLLISADAGNEQFIIRRAANNAQQLILGYHSGGYSTIQSIQQLVAYTPLVLNPNGGNVLIGTTTDAGQKLQVSGDIYTFNSVGGGVTTLATGATPSIEVSNGNGYFKTYKYVMGGDNFNAYFFSSNVVGGDAIGINATIKEDGTNCLVQIGDMTVYGNGTTIVVNDATSRINFASLGKYNFSGILQFANNAAALAGGLVNGDIYRITGTGDLKIVI